MDERELGEGLIDSDFGIGNQKINESKEVMKYSRKGDPDGPWKTGPVIKAFTANVLRDLIEYSGEPAAIRNFQLPKFLVPCCKFSKFEFSEKLEDGLCWWKSLNGKRKRPRPGNILLGQNYRYYNCVSPIDERFRKYVVYPEDNAFLLIAYVSAHPPPSYEMLSSGKKEKITEMQKRLVNDALDGRNVKQAYNYLLSKNVNVTDIQVRNQSRYQPNVVKCKRGRKNVTTPEMLAELSFVSGVTTWSEGTSFCLSYIDDDLMRVFVNQLPTTETVFEWKRNLDGCENWNISELNEFLDKNSLEFNSGIVRKMAGQVQIDTTFDLCDLAVTTVTADFPVFLTKKSNKFRHVLIAFMLSSSKSARHHQKFAEIINEKLFNCDKKQKKCVPAIVTDGESGFQSYLDAEYFENSQKLRCLLHRRKNYEMVNRTCPVTKKEKEAVFGIEKNGEVTGGVLNVMNISTMKERISNLKIDQQRKKWLMDRMDSLFQTDSLKSRLLAGFSLNFCTTNRTECINSRLKLEFTRRTDGRECSRKLMSFMDDEKRILCDSVLTNKNGIVSFSSFEKRPVETIECKVRILWKCGFNTFAFPYAMNAPNGLWRYFDVPNLKSILETQTAAISDSEYAIKSGKGFIRVALVDDLYECNERKCQSDGKKICIHVICVLLKLTPSKCQSVLNRMELIFNRRSQKAIAKVYNNGNVSKRFPGRQYSVQSHGNSSRTVQRFISCSSERSRSRSPLPTKNSKKIRTSREYTSVSPTPSSRSVIESECGSNSNREWNSLSSSSLDSIQDATSSRYQKRQRWLSTSSDDSQDSSPEERSGNCSSSIAISSMELSRDAQLDTPNTSVSTFNISNESIASGRSKRNIRRPTKYKDYFNK